MPIDAGPMFQQQRQLLGRADENRAALWDNISSTIATLKGAGHSHQQIAKTLAPVMEPLRKLTMSSGRDETSISTELALLYAKPAPQPSAAPEWSFAEHPDVDRYTRALSIAPHDSDLSAAFADRLRQALQSTG